VTPSSIILHHSLTKDDQVVSWGAIRRYHVETLGWSDVGYHFGIELVGNAYEVFVGRMLNEVGAHCKGRNTDSIGVCFVGNFDTSPPPREQWHLGVRLVRAMCDIFAIPNGQVFPHHRFASYKSCPGRKFDVAKFLSEL
jgi:hypothetical protein